MRIAYVRKLVATCVKEGMKRKAGGTFAVKSFLVEWSEMIA